jgi:hypothetical protein
MTRESPAMIIPLLDHLLHGRSDLLRSLTWYV